jgi:hypothetical protein
MKLTVEFDVPDESIDRITGLELVSFQVESFQGKRITPHQIMDITVLPIFEKKRKLKCI